MDPPPGGPPTRWSALILQPHHAGAFIVTKYQYWTDWDNKVPSATPSQQGGSVSVKLRPLAAGNHTLYVNSIDRAGNVSDEPSSRTCAGGHEGVREAAWPPARDHGLVGIKPVEPG
ncbi:hypothetical protein OG244_04230 [Streptomyces brevispora]|uniref:hypothetical protein n=1 Tax=Streptomyces brevispora TaxID=887462 RepID=UPI002E3020ED|nr:hypothetical protein [Streptomyces brevispora]